MKKQQTTRKLLGTIVLALAVIGGVTSVVRAERVAGSTHGQNAAWAQYGCPPGYTGSRCVPKCPPRYTLQDERCVPGCPPGEAWNRSKEKCEEPCSSGYMWTADRCVSLCKSGYTWRSDNRCEPNCPSGYSWKPDRTGSSGSCADNKH